MFKYSILSVSVMAETTHLSKEVSPTSVVSLNVKICSCAQFCYTWQFPLRWTKFSFPFSLDMCALSTLCSSGIWVQACWMVLWTSLRPSWFILSDHRTAPCTSHRLPESTQGARPQLWQSQLHLSVYILDNSDTAVSGRSMYMLLYSTKCRRWFPVEPQI